jgi:hypothetical protein
MFTTLVLKNYELTLHYKQKKVRKTVIGFLSKVLKLYKTISTIKFISIKSATLVK